MAAILKLLPRHSNKIQVKYLAQYLKVHYTCCTVYIKYMTEPVAGHPIMLFYYEENPLKHLEKQLYRKCTVVQYNVHQGTEING